MAKKKANEPARGRSPGASRLLTTPRRSLRRRVALAFAAAVAVTALALSLSAYYTTKIAQQDDALQKALEQSRFNLGLADNTLPPEPTSSDYTKLLNAFLIRPGFSTLIYVGPGPNDLYLSGPYLSTTYLSADLKAAVSSGRVAYQNIMVGSDPNIIVGGQVRASGVQLYFFFSQGALLARLRSLRTILLAAGGVLLVLGTFAGGFLARRLFRPVKAASVAAAHMSEGDLDIRLPGGSDEFGVLASSFNRMAENLQAQMTDLEAGQARERRFAADVTHELRTPVAALVGEASLLRAKLEALPDGTVTPDVRRIAQLVTTDIGRLRLLVDDLLEISRLDAGAAELVLEPVDVHEFLSQVKSAHGWPQEVEIVASAADEPSRAPVGGTPGHGTGSAVILQTDKRRLERIMVNLVENSLRHGVPPVRVETQASSDTVWITVTDNGAGIPREHLPHIFERFYKADPSRASSRGSGLGLAIARENARLLGGELTAATMPGAGARFVLTLPNPA
jgi:two-component system sensor histidine kinase MtrB